MVVAIGVVDEQPYPGPNIPDPRLPWGDPDSDPIGALREFAYAYATAVVSAFNPLADRMMGLIAAYGTVDEAMDGALVAHGKHHLAPKPMASGRPAPPRHVGPRPARAFGPRGRRNY